MGLLERISAARGRERSITTLEDYALALQSALAAYPGVSQTIAGDPAERAPNDLTGYTMQAYAGNGPVFALMAVRALVFSAVRFQYQRLNGGRPSGLFGDQSLSLLETPWTGGTTQDLLARMILDVDLAGNAYWARVGGELVRLRPDWVEIVLAPRRFRGGILGYQKLGYVYTEGGSTAGDPVPLLVDEVAHFAPYPDPLATYRGMSWLTPVLRELQNDKLMGRHQQKFFQNGATPNMVVTYDPTVSVEKFKAMRKIIDEGHAGAENAYKTLHLGAGADATVVGSNFEQMSFTATQGRVETRLAAAAGVPPVIVGFSEGLQGSSLNAGNFSSARRRMADATMHPLWSNVAGSLATLAPAPAGAQLWYDARDVPFLREDARDAAEIEQIKAASIRNHIDAGFKPDAAIQAVQSEDVGLLVSQHTGLFSVQLQPPPDPNAPPPTDQQTNDNQPSTTEVPQ